MTVTHRLRLHGCDKNTGWHCGRERQHSSRTVGAYFSSRVGPMIGVADSRRFASTRPTRERNQLRGRRRETDNR